MITTLGTNTEYGMMMDDAPCVRVTYVVVHLWVKVLKTDKHQPLKLRLFRRIFVCTWGNGIYPEIYMDLPHSCGENKKTTTNKPRRIRVMWLNKMP